ncbi:hypothetical protein ACFLTH_17005 [Bacteroidota bacterium]
MIEEKLEKKISKKKKKDISEIPGLSDRDLDYIIDCETKIGAGEQVRQANVKLTAANKKAKEEYLKGENWLAGKAKGVLYDFGIVSPEKELQKKNDDLLIRKTELKSDLQNVKTVIEEGYHEIIDSEKRKLAIDIKINRKQNEMNSELEEYNSAANTLLEDEVDTVKQSQLECEMQQSYLNQVLINNEIEELTAKYVLTHNRSEKLNQVLSSQELELQRLMKTFYDLQAQTEETEIMMKRGVSPKKVLTSMQQSYSLIERCERIRGIILKSSYDISDAISDIKIVGSHTAKENDKLYQKNEELATKSNQSFRKTYEEIKSNYRERIKRRISV